MSLQEELMQCIQDGDTKRATEIVWQSLSTVNGQDRRGRTPLHKAAAKDQDEFLGVLLRNKANIDTKDSDGQTPLHVAAGYHSAASLRVLLKARAKVDAKSNDGWTPLHGAAVGGGSVDCLRTLLAGGANIDAKTEDGKTALQMTRENGNEDCVALLDGGWAAEESKRGGMPSSEISGLGQVKCQQLVALLQELVAQGKAGGIEQSGAWCEENYPDLDFEDVSPFTPGPNGPEDIEGWTTTEPGFDEALPVWKDYVRIMTGQ
jgi:hypothetical protein